MTSHRRHLLLNDIGNASNASDREDEPWQTALTSARTIMILVAHEQDET